jgi:hypothetical protein
MDGIAHRRGSTVDEAIDMLRSQTRRVSAA